MTCRLCPARVRARGLCAACYGRVRRAGDLSSHPAAGRCGAARKARPSYLDVAEDVDHLLLCGCTCHGGRSPHVGVVCVCGGAPALAARLGMSTEALRKALQRARRHAEPPAA